MGGEEHCVIARICRRYMVCYCPEGGRQKVMISIEDDSSEYFKVVERVWKVWEGVSSKFILVPIGYG